MKKIPLFWAMGASFLVHNLLAVDFTFSPVRQESNNDYESVTFDAASGKYYQRPGFNADVTGMFEYANSLAFEAGISTRTVTLEQGYYGSYVAADGALFGRSQLNTDFTGSDSSRYNLTTGAIERTASFPTLGQNRNDTFDWGGLTSMNFYSDPSGTYLLAKTAAPGGQTWQLSKVDSDLNIVSSKTFQDSTMGFATMINGKLYTGAHGQNILGDLVTSGFDHVFDFSTGDYNPFQIDFLGIGDTQYIDNMIYDPSNDTMYLHNVQTQYFYKMGDVSEALGGSVSVPENGSAFAFLTMALGSLWLTSRSVRFGKS
jgi:hypothetical protein